MKVFLEIFLLIDVFIIGVVAEIAYRHAMAHYRPKPIKKVNSSQDNVEHLTRDMKQKLIDSASLKYEHILDTSSHKLEQDLNATSERINITIKKLSADILTKELEGFQSMLQSYRQQAQTELSSVKAQTDKYEQELRAKMESEVEAEKQRLIQSIDNKLADAVMSFILEAMQHQVDLGSQTDYLLKVLDEHKASFKEALNDGN